MSGIAVGVDVGGSSTVAAISQNGKLQRTACANGSNPSAVGLEAAAQVINDLIEQLLGGEHPEVICIGAAGAGRPEIAGFLKKAVRDRFPGARVRVHDDAFIGLRAAGVQRPAIILIAGTGSIALADNGMRMERTGGFGYLLGDEGSGFAIGLAAAKSLSRCFDARSTGDEFTGAIGNALMANSREELIERVYPVETRVTKIAALAPIVLEFASGGNRNAQRIVQSAALELAELVKAVAHKAGLSQAQPTVVLSGGLLRENSMLSFLLETRMQSDLPGVSIVRRPAEPVLGALQTAHALLAKRTA